MRKVLLLFIVLVAVAGAQETRRGDDFTLHHGVRVEDPYRWLEKADAPEVKAWIEQQNQKVEAALKDFPGRQALVERIDQLSLTGPRQYSPRLAGGKLLFMREVPPQPQPVLVSQDWPQGAERVLVDTNTQKNPSAITDFWPSPKGRYVAYGTAEGGNELTTIYVVETATGKRLEDRLVDAGGGTTPPALVWDADETGFTYVRLPQDSLFNASLYHHRLGQPQTEDEAAFGQGLSRIAEWQLSASPGGAQAAALVHFGDGAPTRVFLRGPEGWKAAVGPEVDMRAGGHWLGQKLLLVSFQDAPRGKVMTLDAQGRLETLIPQGQWAIVDAFPLGGGLLIQRVWGTRHLLEHRDASGKLVRVLPLPRQGVAIGEIASSNASQTALISLAGWTDAGRWITYQADSGQTETVFKVEAPGDQIEVESEVIEAVSRDGTRVPVTVLYQKGTRPDGQRPTILYAYGGFGVLQAPRYMGPTLAWLERGGVYAVAVIRGGGEFGEAWHQDGSKTAKQHCFDDFMAAAEVLHQSGWTRPEKLGLMGGSNGGLLVGATMVQKPGVARAVVALVGVLDSLRHEIWPNGQYNVPEYGTFENKEQFEAILAYSPLQNVKPGTPYPSVLLYTGENDLRVAPWQSRKFAAALQHATSSSNPILLQTKTNAGHGQGASFSQKVGRTALTLTFLAQELGLSDR